jgi:hypothetical protein
MIQQMNENDSMYEQVNPTYSGYQDKQAYDRQKVQTSDSQFQWEEPGEKVFAPRRDHKNMLRFALATMAMVTMITIAVLCMLSSAGEVGWLGFGIASFAIFLTAFMAIEKTQ